jgi:hypothetical protein
METDAKIEPAGSPVPGANRVLSPRRRDPASTALAKLLSVIRGDKYLVDAYPPAWHAAACGGDSVASHDHDGDGTAGVQPNVASPPNAAKRADPAESETKER